MAQIAELADYAQIATEYYDAFRHPTCKNFRDASAIYLASALFELDLDGLLLEVGSGRSILAELLAGKAASLEKTVLIDRSAEMLAHSAEFGLTGATLVVADAAELPFSPHSASVIVACLGDAYNVEGFWKEVARCLHSDGACIFTTPSFEWAREFRSSSHSERDHAAYFQLQGGDEVYVPSIIYPAALQTTLIESAGLRVVEAAPVCRGAISLPHSRKLWKLEGMHPVVVGYTVRRR